MNFKEYSKEETIGIVKEALNKFMENDKILLNIDANENAMSHKIAGYLDDEFENGDVDCEYNRQSKDSKNISDICSEFDNVRPDIIVHKRVENFNHLVIEIKKDASEDNKKKDIRKLYWLKKKFNYKYALFINFNTKKLNPECIWDFDTRFNDLLDINIDDEYNMFKKN